MNPWQTHSSRITYENQWIRVREDTVTRPDNCQGIYGVVEVRHPAVLVVAVTEADEWQRIGGMVALNGVCDAPEHIFLARGLHESAETAEQEEEGITAVRRVPWPELMGMVRDGTITDAETLAALLHAGIALGRIS